MSRYTNVPTRTYTTEVVTTSVRTLFWNEGAIPVRVFTTVSGGDAPNGRDRKGILLYPVNTKMASSIPINEGMDVYFSKDVSGKAIIQSMEIG